MKQNEVKMPGTNPWDKPKDPNWGKGITTDQDIGLAWMWFMCFVIIVIGARFVSWISGGDKPEEFLWGPRPPPEKLD